MTNTTSYRFFQVFSLLSLILIISGTANAAWTPPVGIPHPKLSFEGFDPIEAPAPVASTYCPAWAINLPNSVTVGQANDCYYVDNTQSTATDTSNVYGMPSKPRKTIPATELAAGSYVEIHGDGGVGTVPYATFYPRGIGTAAKPIWYVGVNKPVITEVDVGYYATSPLTKYLMIDGFFVRGSKITIRPRADNININHIVFRHMDINGTGKSAVGSGFTVGSSSLTGNRLVSDIVLYSSSIYNYGDKTKPAEECGVAPSFNLDRFWVLDNHIHDNAEDGLAGGHGAHRTLDHYYIGRNEIDHNITNAIDIKHTNHVVISENIIHDHYTSDQSSGPSDSVILHYSGTSTPGGSATAPEDDVYTHWPADVLVINNTIYNSVGGIRTSKADKVRIIGNLIYNIHHDASKVWDPDPSSPYSPGAAIHLRGNLDDTYVINNTLFGNDIGIEHPDGYSAYVNTTKYYCGDAVFYSGAYYSFKNSSRDICNAGITGIPPTNATYWKSFKIIIKNNIISHRLTLEGRDINISERDKARYGVEMDYNQIYSAFGPSINYGSNTLQTLEGLRSDFSQCEHCLISDPGFVDPTTFNFSLKADSPAKDAGILSNVYQDFFSDYGIDILKDAKGIIRPQNSKWDIGAFEYSGAGVDGATPPPLSIPLVVNAGVDQTVSLSGSASLSATITGGALGAVLITTWSKQAGTGTVNFTNPNSAATAVTFSTAGFYVLRMTVSVAGVVLASDDVGVTVSAPTNVAPTIILSSPGISFVAPASMTLSANASDSDGTISKVEFYNGATLLGTDTNSPYTYDWNGVPAGTYNSVTAKATDNSGATATSNTINFTVRDAPPTTDTVVPAITSIVSSGPIVTWTTNEPGDSQVEYGLTTSYGNTTTITDISPKVTSHSVTLLGLTLGTTYHFRVKSRDAAGNLGASGDSVLAAIDGFTLASGMKVLLPPGLISASSAVLTAPMTLDSANGFVSTSAVGAGTAKFTVNVSEDGTYTLWSRGFASSTSSDGIYLSIDGATESTFNFTVSTDWTWKSVGTYDLSAGPHTVTFRGADKGLQLKYIVLTKVADYTGFTTSKTLEETPVTILLNLADAPYTIATNPASGTLVQDATNSAKFVYTPKKDFFGSDTFYFKSRVSGTVSVKYTIAVQNVNDAPPAMNLNFYVRDKETVKTIPLPAKDVDSDTLTYSIVTPPTKGTATLTAGVLTYTPPSTRDSSLNSGVPVKIQAKDPSGAITESTFTFNFLRTMDPAIQKIAGVNVIKGFPLVVPTVVKVQQPLTFKVEATGAVTTIDPATLPAGATFDGTNFNWTPQYKQAGTHLLRFLSIKSGETIPQDVLITVDWVAPLAIPDDATGLNKVFGIRESVYQVLMAPSETCTSNPNKCYDYGAGPVPYLLDEYGEPYTHFVDPSNPLATDTSNPMGTMDHPRKSLPQTISLPGSIVTLRGTFSRDTLGSSTYNFTGNGSEDRPIYFRGTNHNAASVQNLAAFHLYGNYIVLENMEFIGSSPDNRPRSATEFVHHIGTRNVRVHGEGGNGFGNASYVAGNPVHHFVYYNDEVFTDGFDPTVPFPENDQCGIGISQNSNHIWIVDSNLHHVRGDSVGAGHGAQYTASEYYIGRNELHDNGENSVDLKEVENVIVSQNKMYNLYGASGGAGGGGVAVVIHYGPQLSPINVWILNNDIYHMNGGGIQTGGDQAHEVFLIGNTIHDIHNDAGTATGYQTWGSTVVNLVGNVIYDVDNGVKASGSSKSEAYYLDGVAKWTLDPAAKGAIDPTKTIYHAPDALHMDHRFDMKQQMVIKNNIFANIKSNGFFIHLDDSTYSAEAIINNNLFYQPGATVINSSGALSTTYFSGVPTATNSFTGDPRFVDAAHGDFHLSSGSAAIDRGETLNYSQRFLTRFGWDLPTETVRDGDSNGTAAFDIGPNEFAGVGSAIPPPDVTPVPPVVTSPAPPVTPSNVAPTVSITAPLSADSFTDPATITLKATAADADGIANVEFFSVSTLGVRTSILKDTTTPYETAPIIGLPQGNFTFVAVATDTKGAQTTSSPVTITVKSKPISTNTAPTISDIPDMSFYAGIGLASASFTVADTETTAANLKVSATSSNTTLVPAANIVLGGSGNNRTIKVTPVDNQKGTSIIKVTVTDGSASTSSDEFTLNILSNNESSTPVVPLGMKMTTPPGIISADALAAGDVVAPMVKLNSFITTPTSNSGSATFNITVSKEADYTLMARVIAPGGASDSFFYSINGGAPIAWFLPASTEWVWTSLSKIHLKNGANTFTVSGRESNAKLSHIALAEISDIPTTYYVDQENPKADDSNPGTEALPFKTIQKVANIVNPGDTVLIKAGTYQDALTNCVGSTCNFLTISQSGTADKPITFKTYNNDHVVLSGLGFEDRDLDGNGQADGPLNPSKREALITISGNYIHINGFDITNSQQKGITVDGSFNVIENVKSHDNWLTGISVGSNSKGLVQGNVIKNVETYHNRHGAGIAFDRPSGATDILTQNTIKDSISYFNGYQPKAGFPTNPDKVLPIPGDTEGGGNSDGVVASKYCVSEAKTVPGYQGIVEKTKFLEVDSNGAAILQSLITSGVLKEDATVTSAVRLVDNTIPDRPTALSSAHFDEVWELLIRNCVCTNNVLDGVVVWHNADDGFDISLNKSLVLNTISFDNGPEGTKGYKIFSHIRDYVFVGNIAYANYGRGFEFRIDSGAVFMNNVAIGNGEQGFQGVLANSKVVNNLAYNNDLSTIAANSNEFGLPPVCPLCSNNWIGDGKGTWSGDPLLVNKWPFKNAEGKIEVVYPRNDFSIAEKVNWIKDQFKNAFSLQSNSKAIDAGIATSWKDPITNALSTRVIKGSASDLGVFEYEGSGVVSPTWTPPIGIPAPSFGIEATYRMYDDANPLTTKRNSALSYTLNPQGGFYTHYVDNSNPCTSTVIINCGTDTSNPYGTVSKPRLTIPYPLPEGSVVEIRGGGYLFSNLSGKYLALGGTGTVQRPIFIRGPGRDMPYLFNAMVYPSGSYVVIENMAFYKNGIDIRPDFMKVAINHIALRNLEFKADGNETGNGAAIEVGGWGVRSPDQPIDNIVVYNTHIHDFGLIDSDVENDWIGVAISGWDTSYVWVLDNQMENLSSAGVRTGNNESTDYPNAHHTFIGRNTIHDGGENAIAIKQTNDVVVSQNVAYGFKASEHNDGDIYNVLFSPRNVWFLFNKAYNTTSAAFKSSGAQDLYIIGNLVYDVSYGVKFWRDGYINMINNTFVNYDYGIANASASAVTTAHVIRGNIFSSSKGKDIAYTSSLSSLADISSIDHNLFYHPDGAQYINWGGKLYTDVAKMQTQTGKCQGCLMTNPKFVNESAKDFSLLSDSPAINTGSIPSEYLNKFKSLFGVDISYDFNGNVRPDNWDMGAYEYQGTTLPQPEPVGNPWTVEAGADQAVTMPTAVTLDGTLKGLASGLIATTTWSKISGPGTVTFANPSSVDTKATFSVAGAYVLRLTATDGITTTSDDITVTVNSAVNVPPTFISVSPLPTDTFIDPGTFVLKANVADSDGTIASVEFFDNTDPKNMISISKLTKAPYEIPLSGFPVGSFAFKAVVTDDQGASASKDITVTVNPKPIVDGDGDGVIDSLDRCPGTPAGVAVNAVGCAIFKASKFDIKPSIDGDLSSVTGVEFGKTGLGKIHFNTAVPLVGADIDSNVTIEANKISLNSSVLTKLNVLSSLTFYGVDKIKPVVTHNGGACPACSSSYNRSTKTLTVNVSGFSSYEVIEGAVAPTISISAPSVTLPSNVVISTSATDSDGSIAKVEFFNGSAKVGESTVAPFGFTWLATAGSYSLTAKATDNDGLVTTSSPVAVTVNPKPNTMPVAANQSLGTDKNTPKVIVLSGSDVDGNSLTYSIVSNPSHGSLSGSGANRTYTPNNNYSGTDSFTFKVNDGTVDSLAAKITMTIDSTNTAPVAVPQTIITNEDTAKTVVLSGSDVDDDDLSYVIVSAPAHGTLSGSAPNLTYTPAFNYNGSDSFTFKANDGSLDSAAATVSVTVTPVNDAPTVVISVPSSVTLPASVIINASPSDIDGTINKVEFFNGSTKIGEITSAPYNFTWTPAAGTYSITAKATDNGGLLGAASLAVSVTVNPKPNAVPLATALSVTTAEDTAKAIILSGSDADSDSLTFIKLSDPTHGTLSGTAPNLTYTPNANYNGSDSFTFKVNDGKADSLTATVSVTVTPVNDAPTADSKSMTTSEGVSKDVTLSGNDVEHSTLTYVITANPAHGSLTGSGANLTYQPDAGYSGSDSFTYETFDGALSSAPATVSISVNKADSYTITSSGGVGGIISPAGNTAVATGSSQTFTITPLPGFKVSEIKIDGVVVGMDSSYTFDHVDAAHTINVSFEKNVVLIPNIPPVAMLSSLPAGGVSPVTINFDASESKDTDGSIVSYQWDFGDGSPVVTGEEGISHIYKTPGTYKVWVNVIDNKGANSTASVTVVVSAPAAPTPPPTTGRVRLF